jgi:FkbM family methyltransferase
VTLLRSSLRKAIPRRLLADLCERFPQEGLRLSYSQEGEDLLLGRLFDGQRTGFYVDVGAHHPTLFSNTYLFYRRGWRGINIDAMPGSMQAFRSARPRDLSLEAAISSSGQALTYYMYNWPALNTFSAELYRHREQAREERDAGYRCIGKQEIKTRALREVLDENLPAAARHDGIDFLNVDVEGFDLDVLQSNDWTTFHPRVVVAEILESDLQAVASDPVSTFLRGKGYVAKAKCINSVVYVRQT